MNNAEVMNIANPISILGGTGDQGLGLALRWAQAGCSIIIGSRDKARAESAAEQVRTRVGPAAQVSGMENPDAVRVSTIIVLAVPFSAQIPTLKSVKASFKPGDLLMDLT